MEHEHLIKSNNDEQIVMDITPESANWKFLSYRIVQLSAGESVLT